MPLSARHIALIWMPADPNSARPRSRANCPGAATATAAGGVGAADKLHAGTNRASRQTRPDPGAIEPARMTHPSGHRQRILLLAAWRPGHSILPILQRAERGRQAVLPETLCHGLPRKEGRRSGSMTAVTATALQPEHS
jgi:hypothetical protein